MTSMRYVLLFSAILLSTLSSQAQFQVNNDATSLGGGYYRMTQAVNNQYGSVWYKLQADLTDPLNVQGQMYFGNDDAGADGIAFVIQNNCLAAGTAGGGIGYEALPGQSIAVEFDTYQNILGTGSFDNSDPVEDHIAVMSNGVVNHASANNLFGPVQASSTNVNIEDGAWHDFQINYNPTTHLLTVYFDGIQRVSYTIDIVNAIFAGNPYAYWGFTSSTGGFFNEQQVYINGNLTTITLPDQTTCASPVTVSLPPLNRYYGLNQALHRSAVMSSTEYGPTNASEAFDGNMGSRWSSQPADPQWLYVDLGTNYDLDSVVLYWEAAYATQYQIQVSNDAVTWTTLYTEVAGDGGKDKILINSNNRYVRMYGTTRATGYGYSIWEFQVYGKPNYVWSPNNGTISPNIYSADPTFTPAVTTTYTVLVPDPCSVVVSYSMTITVDCGSLPVNLLSFDGNYDRGATHLNWVTA